MSVAKATPQEKDHVEDELVGAGSDAARWRFVIAFREKRNDITTFYLDISKAIHRSGRKDLLDLARVDVVDPDRSVVSALQGVIAIEGNGRIRFSRNHVNGVYLEDALIYRLSA